MRPHHLLIMLLLAPGCEEAPPFFTDLEQPRVSGPPSDFYLDRLERYRDPRLNVSIRKPINITPRDSFNGANFFADDFPIASLSLSQTLAQTRLNIGAEAWSIRLALRTLRCRPHLQNNPFAQASEDLCRTSRDTAWSPLRDPQPLGDLPGIHGGSGHLGRALDLQGPVRDCFEAALAQTPPKRPIHLRFTHKHPPHGRATRASGRDLNAPRGLSRCIQPHFSRTPAAEGQTQWTTLLVAIEPL